MPEYLATSRTAGLAVLAVASAAWLVVAVRKRRRNRARRLGPAVCSALPALPQQRRSGPDREAVELTPAERDAFAGLVRRLNGGN